MSIIFIIFRTLTFWLVVPKKILVLVIKSIEVVSPFTNKNIISLEFLSFFEIEFYGSFVWFKIPTHDQNTNF